MALLDGKVCVITGGAGSLGLASARLFLAEGAKVMLVDLRQADLERARAELGSSAKCRHRRRRRQRRRRNAGATWSARWSGSAK